MSRHVEIDRPTYHAMRRKVKSMKLIGTYSFPNGWQSTYEDTDGKHWSHGEHEYGHSYVITPDGTSYYYI
jgi:hypothetical protein